jgi:hypothetical protein
MNEQKEVVRVIENKVSLPEKIGFKSFFKQIVTPKQGVPIPEKIVWNGAMTNGETAPDGKYFYYVTATDDNGNEGKTKEYEVVVDTLAPQVELAQISDKIFGEGAKSSLKIRLSSLKFSKFVIELDKDIDNTSYFVIFLPINIVSNKCVNVFLFV